jgi:hypothetical protein
MITIIIIYFLFSPVLYRVVNSRLFPGFEKTDARGHGGPAKWPVTTHARYRFGVPGHGQEACAVGNLVLFDFFFPSLYFFFCCEWPRRKALPQLNARCWGY